VFKHEQPVAAVPGGSTFNTIVSLARLGVPVSFVTDLGDDRVGELIKNYMRANHIGTDYIESYPQAKSPVSLAFLNEQNDASYTFFKDFPEERLSRVALPPVEAGDVVILGSYYAIDPRLRARHVELLKAAKARGAVVYYDPNFRSAHAAEKEALLPHVLENFAYADIVRGSEEDFQNLFGLRDADRIYREVARYCPRFIYTGGAREVVLFDGRRCRHYPNPKITPVSTIGAGDNFNAGVLCGLLHEGATPATLDALAPEAWDRIIGMGQQLAKSVCLSLDNSISPEAAQTFKTLYL